MFKGKKILVIGGTGSWGTELTRQLLEDAPEEIRIFSRGEHKQVEMKRRFSNHKETLKFIIGDVRDFDRLHEASREVDIIFHLAALKHVPVCEENPNETVQTNILGTENAIRAAGENHVPRYIFVSTDKAVDPINVYGVSKSLAEKLVTAANLRFSHTKFFCVRGGNVIGSNGSVIPLFKEQILKQNAITITNPSMTRFLLSLEEAITLLFRAASEGVGGEIYVMKMSAVTVQQIADVMIRRLGDNETEQRIIGERPGEKHHEVLVSSYETRRTIDDGAYFVILPSLHITKVLEKHRDAKRPLTTAYRSDNTAQLSDKELEDVLEGQGSFDPRKETGLEHLSDEQIVQLFRLEGWTWNEDDK